MISLLMDPQLQETLATFSCPSPIETSPISPGQRCRRTVNHWRWVGGNHPVWLGTWLGTLFVSPGVTLSQCNPNFLGISKWVILGIVQWLGYFLEFWTAKVCNQRCQHMNPKYVFNKSSESASPAHTFPGEMGPLWCAWMPHQSLGSSTRHLPARTCSLWRSGDLLPCRGIGFQDSVEPAWWFILWFASGL